MPYQEASVSATADGSPEVPGLNEITLGFDQDAAVECPRYFNEAGAIDLGKDLTKRMWRDGHRGILGMPTDMTCMAGVQCGRLLGDGELFKVI